MVRKSIRFSYLRKDEGDGELYPGTGTGPGSLYFFSPAVQFNTSVIGAGAVCTAGRLNRNRCPSFVTAEPCARVVAKRSFGADTWNVGSVLISTSFRISGGSKYTSSRPALIHRGLAPPFVETCHFCPVGGN